MDFKIAINETEIRAVAEKAAQERATTLAKQIVGEYFSSKRNYGSTDGVGTLLIQEKIDQYLLSKDMDTMLQQAVDRCLNQTLEALAQEVVRHRLGKILFADFPSKIDLERVRTIFRGVLEQQTAVDTSASVAS